MSEGRELPEEIYELSERKSTVVRGAVSGLPIQKDHGGRIDFPVQFSEIMPTTTSGFPVDKFVIQGGRRLHGTVTISGAKNATLALMPAAILASGTYRLTNTPILRDVNTMAALLRTMGMEIESQGHQLTLETSSIDKFEAPYDHVKKMRASIYVLGPLIARFGRAKVSLPGGCAWGPRPVNLHIEGIKKLGAIVDIEGGYIVAKAEKLTGTRIHFDVSSVGATGNILMAAVRAHGTTVIENSAIEPEITALGNFLVSMGAKISGLGTNRLEVEGVDELHATDAAMIPDRVEAGTFLVAAAITGGTVTLQNVNAEHVSSVLAKLKDAGCSLSMEPSRVTITGARPVRPVDVTATIYPGFPTDMQAQWIALMAVAGGTSVVADTIYLDRFKHVPELIRLGADIKLKENAAVVRGVDHLTGAKVMSTDLRASASLILAGLVAHGTTEVLRVYHIDRGYEAIESKLRSLGADIERVAGEEF